MTAARFRGVKCDRTGAKGRAGTEAACGKGARLSRGRLRVSDGLS